MGSLILLEMYSRHFCLYSDCMPAGRLWTGVMRLLISDYPWSKKRELRI